jgi:hypothetical protein
MKLILLIQLKNQSKDEESDDGDDRFKHLLILTIFPNFPTVLN